MNLKQLFCDHIWETQYIHLVRESIRYVLDTPLSRKKAYLVTSMCAKCKKIKKEEQIKERSLSIEEIKTLIEFDKVTFKSKE